MDEIFKKRLMEWANRSWNQGVYCFSHFLDLAQRSDFLSLIPSLPPVPWRLFGGAEGCERQMLRFGNEEACGYDAPFPIVCLIIAPLSAKFAEPLTHRDYLGSLMALGMERETMGDIVVRKDGAYLFCEDRIAPYIMEHFVQARHTSLSCEIVENLPEGALFETRRVSVQLSSQRVDALIAHVFKMSRGDAQDLFPAGKVFVSGRLCESPGYTPKPGDIISVRGFGRMKYVGIESLSKKGKENTVAELYV
ncbi:MAG: YlmH/Sll1252 family protein [Clostridia bacterium]|nr:YlmH/Sll1252 family protein [Clostridia bacterium]